MLFKGSLSQCVDFLARLPSTLWTDVFIIIHVPSAKCYHTMTLHQHAQICDGPVAVPQRLLFRGSIVELAHFVLCPPLTAHATRQTLPDLPDNGPSAIPDTPRKQSQLHAVDANDGVMIDPTLDPRENHNVDNS